MLQLLPIKPDTGNWHWLHPVKKGGAPLSKTALLNRASSDMSFLRFVCNMPTEAIKVRFMLYHIKQIILRFKITMILATFYIHFGFIFVLI